MFSGGASTSSLAPPARAPPPLSSYAAVQFTHLLPIKLSHDNYLFWKAQIIPLLRSHGLLCFVDGSYPCPPEHVPIATEGGMVLMQNPEHGAWIQQDQAILSAIVSSLTPSVFGMVLFAASAHEAWSILTTSFSAQSTSRSMQIHNKLGQMKKRDMSAHAFYNLY
jgi:hypothetical protein